VHHHVNSGLGIRKIALLWSEQFGTEQDE